MFKFGDKVKVVDESFFKGSEGVVVGRVGKGGIYGMESYIEYEVLFQIGTYGKIENFVEKDLVIDTPEKGI